MRQQMNTKRYLVSNRNNNVVTFFLLILLLDGWFFSLLVFILRSSLYEMITTKDGKKKICDENINQNGITDDSVEQ